MLHRGRWEFLAQQLVFDSPYGENRHYWKGHFVSELSDELMDELLERIIAFARPQTHFLIESLHGAPKDADPGLGGIAYRGAAFNVSAMAVWSGADDDDQHIDWARESPLSASVPRSGTKRSSVSEH